jgi:hypothetical protein
MNSRIVLACGLAAALIGFAAPASADPQNVRAYCATHINAPGPGEEGDDQLPPAVRHAQADRWRCMGGHVMVCNAGATGFACMRMSRVDGQRLAAFRDFCRQNPGSDPIPQSLAGDVASEWRCAGARPVKDRIYPTDRLGYLRESWRALR